ncbi:MAG: 5,10-methylenetetrahydrofolate reductase [Desulfobacula sp.]|uniref:methylenetetrahydrofolate reductase C-terminal domain-containing protein n=2 Tax=Desulfobacula sp. TaxID=2593537 RepID=UPI0039B88159|nr:5,10-methylenetetrahydrofolate reductase [Desulfobacula sp.]
MHATIQKPIDEIVKHIRPGEKVFVVGCNNCAWKCYSGGEDETKMMAKRLEKKGVEVAGYTVPGPQGMSLCKLSHTKKVLMEDHAEEVKKADSFLILGCGQGVHTVIDATNGGMVHPGCDTVFGGETVSDTDIEEYCSLCGECIIEFTGGLCPMTLCAKQLLNGPCGGAENGHCEVDKDRPCGWIMIYERLQKLGRLDLLDPYQSAKNNSKWSRPRSLKVSPTEATFCSIGGKITVSNQD